MSYTDEIEEQAAALADSITTWRGLKIMFDRTAGPLVRYLSEGFFQLPLADLGGQVPLAELELRDQLGNSLRQARDIMAAAEANISRYGSDYNPVREGQIAVRLVLATAEVAKRQADTVRSLADNVPDFLRAWNRLNMDARTDSLRSTFANAYREAMEAGARVASSAKKSFFSSGAFTALLVGAGVFGGIYFTKKAG